jgi:hypothetical protein
MKWTLLVLLIACSYTQAEGQRLVNSKCPSRPVFKNFDVSKVDAKFATKNAEKVLQFAIYST